VRVLRRHRLVELFLVRVLRLDWSEVHEEAERLEHAVSERVVDRIDELLGRPGADPHGHPIPSAAGEFGSSAATPLDQVEPGRRVRVARVSDHDAAFLRAIEKLGLRPGTRLTVRSRDAATDSLAVTLAAAVARYSACAPPPASWWSARKRGHSPFSRSQIVDNRAVTS